MWRVSAGRFLHCKDCKVGANSKCHSLWIGRNRNKIHRKSRQNYLRQPKTFRAFTNVIFGTHGWCKHREVSLSAVQRYIDTETWFYRVGHEKVARVKANNKRTRTARGGGVGGGGEMLTARLLTNCSITQRNILTPERISQGHVQMGGGLLFRGPSCIISLRIAYSS
jgi:hypothetical protein